MSRYPHLRLMKLTWFVQLGVPVDVRHAFGGKKVFTRSTGKKSATEANVIAGPIVFGWKAEIEAVRRGLGKPIRDEAERWRVSIFAFMANRWMSWLSPSSWIRSILSRSEHRRRCWRTLFDKYQSQVQRKSVLTASPARRPPS